MSDPASRPRIWLLADGQPGNETQIRGLEAVLRAAGADIDVKSVRANAWHVLGAPLLSGGGLSVDRKRSDPLGPPWPDLVVGTGRRSGPWARHVAQASGGAAKAAMFGQKGANYMGGLDLGLVLAHWNFPDHPKRETALLPPTGALPETLAAAQAAMPDLLDPSVGPWLLLVVGGRCFDHDFTGDEAAVLARRASVAAASLGGALAIATSRRSGAAVETALRQAAPDAAFFPASQRPSPLYALLAAADAAIVTGDSESMIAEAVAAGLPTYVAPVRPRLSLRMAVERGAAALHRLGGPFAWLVERLWSGGVILPPRDLSAMATALEAAGLARIFRESVDLSARPAPNHQDFAAKLLAVARKPVAGAVGEGDQG